MTEIEKMLTELYLEKSPLYSEKLSIIKSMGAKVYRNSVGEHKISISGAADYLESKYGVKNRQNLEIFLQTVFK